MLNDAGYNETEKELKRLERELRKEYQKAANEVQGKLNDYMNKFVKEDKLMYAKVQSGAITEREYKQWRVRHIAIGERWDNLRVELANDMTNADKIARNIVNGYMPEIYAVNFNYATFQMEQAAAINTNFVMYNRNSVNRLIKKNPDLLPKPSEKLLARIRRGEVQRYNQQSLQSALIQGLLQGESIDKLAKRVAVDVGEKNYNSAVRNARTMVTGAQNGGRLDAFKRGEEMGIEQEKMWLATHDSRTRDTHRELDYQQIPIDEAFANGLMYPADPDGEPAEVYNCRCSMRTVIKNVSRNAYKHHDSTIEGMSYDEWKRGHK